MGLIRRLTVSLGVAVSLAATVAIASVGAAGGFGSSGGRFTFTDFSASASYFNPSDGSSTNISADRELFFFRPRAGGPLQGPQPMTVLSVSHFLPNPDPTQPPLLDQSLFAIIPDADFVVSSDLQTAALNATVEVGDCGEVIPLTGAQPAKGTGGCGTGFPPGEITVTATWTGTGVLGRQENSGVSTCGGFTATTHDNQVSAFSANVTASIGASLAFSGGAPTVFGSVSSSEFSNNVAGTGIISAACGGGKGG